MARRRIQVESGLGPRGLRPAASPVDTFVQTDAGQQLSQLADALSEVSPALLRFSQVSFEQERDRALAEGEAAARRAQEEGKTYRQAIKEGLIRPDQSPWFRLGAKEQFGRVAANNYAADLQVAMAEAGVSEATEPEVFDQFEREFRQKWLEEQFGDEKSVALHNAFGRTADALVGGMRRNFAVQAGARLVQQTAEALHQEFTTAIRRGDEGDLSPQEIAKDIQLAANRAVAMGMPGDRVNRMAVNAIAQAALQANDADLLQIMESVETTPGAFLSGTSYGSEAMNVVREQIEDEQWQDMQRANAIKQMEREELRRGLLTESFMSLHYGPGTPINPIFPVEGAGPEDIQSGFGAPRDGGARRHEGVDIFAPRGAPVRAFADGTVVDVATTRLGGKIVKIEADGSPDTHYYAHLDRQDVQVGDRIRAGQQIGTVGNTGNARTTPPHLHFGIYRNGRAVDPQGALLGARTFDEVVRDMAQVDPGAADALLDMRHKYQQRELQERRRLEAERQEAISRDLQADIWGITDPNDPNYVTQEKLIQALRSDDIDLQTAQNLFGQLARRDAAVDEGAIFDDPAWTQNYSTFRSTFGSEFDIDNESALLRHRYSGLARLEWLDWRQSEAGRAADLETRERMAQQILERNRLRAERDMQSGNLLQSSPIPWVNQRVISPQDLNKLEDAWQRRDRNAIADLDARILKPLGIPPRDIETFISAQRQLIEQQTQPQE